MIDKSMGRSKGYENDVTCIAIIQGNDRNIFKELKKIIISDDGYKKLFSPIYMVYFKTGSQELVKDGCFRILFF